MMKEDISLDFFFLASFFDSQKWIKNTFCFFFFHFINLRSEKKKEIRKIMREFVASFLLWSFVVETTRVFHVQNFLHRLLGWTRSLWLPMCVPKKKKTDQQVRATRTIFSCNFFYVETIRENDKESVCVCVDLQSFTVSAWLILRKQQQIKCDGKKQRLINVKRKE